MNGIIKYRQELVLTLNIDNVIVNCRIQWLKFKLKIGRTVLSLWSNIGWRDFMPLSDEVLFKFKICAILVHHKYQP